MSDRIKKYTNKKIDYGDFLKHLNSDALNELLIKTGVPKEKIGEYWLRFLIQYRKPEYWKFSELTNGALDILNKVKNDGFKLAIVTGGIADDKSFKDELENFGIGKFFDISLPNRPSNKMDNEWRKSIQVKEILNTLKIEPSECILIGDYAADIKTAKDFGMKCIIVGKRKFHELKPDITLDSLSEGLKLEFTR
jgi:phosphoglycolate phosphatase-like HAD superfamily hydrolase